MTDREYLAAEFALGILEGEELVEARGLAASDPEFARAVEEWNERLAPLFEEMGEETPPDAVWQRVKAGIDSERSGDVVDLKRRLAWWKGMTAGASAIAASLALVVAFDSTRPPPVVETPARGEMMVASLMSQDKAMMMSATWEPSDKSLMVTPGNMPPEPGRSHELWIIPADGTPRSLGLVTGDEPHRMAVDEAMAPMFAEAATLAVSVEPEGGSPGPGPTGPVIASGALAKV
ncbi:MAG: anti-sigma factor [Sphingomicrobium sp.]